MTTLEQRYLEARAKFVAAVEANGFAAEHDAHTRSGRESREALRREREVDQRQARRPVAQGIMFEAQVREPTEKKTRAKNWMCPVGWCLPTSAAPLPARDGELCQRHYRKLSRPLAEQLMGFRLKGGDVFERVLGEAVKEARKNDEHWHRWAISEGARIEGHEDWCQAVKRHTELVADGHPAKLISGTTGKVLTTDEIDCFSPHQFQDDKGDVWAEGATLSEAITNLTRKPRISVVPPKLHAVNMWTGEVREIGDACKLADRVAKNTRTT